jgi:TetR/AcrR family transcriptional regulator, transcriptional repressor for nem operon
MTEVSNTAEAIIDSARALILAGGYNGFSYADIAAVVGIRKASIHHHFPSKVDLVCSLVKQYRERSIAGFAALQRTSRDPREQLLKYVAYWEQCIVDASAPFCICALMATELPVLPPAVADEVRLHFSTLSAWLTSAFERGAEANLFRDVSDPRAEAESFMALVHGGMLSARVSGDPQRFGMITSSALKRLFG